MFPTLKGHDFLEKGPLARLLFLTIVWNNIKYELEQENWWLHNESRTKENLIKNILTKWGEGWGGVGLSQVLGFFLPLHSS